MNTIMGSNKSKLLDSVIKDTSRNLGRLTQEIKLKSDELLNYLMFNVEHDQSMDVILKKLLREVKRKSEAHPNEEHIYHLGYGFIIGCAIKNDLI